MCTKAWQTSNKLDGIEQIKVGLNGTNMVTEDGDSRFDEAKEERQTEGYTNINDEWKRETPPHMSR